MPPKRKATSSGSKPSKKQKKTPTLKEATRPYADDSSVDSGRNEVRWVLPATARDNDAPDTSDDITNFAPTLYGHNWNQLSTRELPFGFPRLRTPLYKTHTPNAYVPSGNNISQTSQAVLDFFNVIKRDSPPPKKDAPPRGPGPYARNAFEGAFGNEDDDLAVVASRSNENPVLALNQDYRLEVNIRDGDRDESAHINVLRRAPPPTSLVPEAVVTGHAYFIELPAVTNITVNGRTYVNNRNVSRDDADAEASKPATTSPFIIGPFTAYTVIELLSQPVFFFRNKQALSFTGPLVLGAKARPSAEELGNRDKNGDVSAENATITWIPIGTAAPRPQVSPKGPKTGGKNGEGSSTTPTQSGAQDPHLEESATYDDTWTDQGEPIADPSEYIQRHLVEPHQIRYNELVPRILAAINDRQPSPAGFGFHHGDRILRPGRTLIAPLNYGNRHVLLVAQNLPNGRSTLRIMDPMAWRSLRTDRDQLVQQARQFLASGRWWRESYDSQQSMERYLPEAVEWVPCAQHTVREQAVVYTVLNAWAIAFGLEPNSVFRLSRDEAPSFFTQVQRLFDLAIQDGLDWKMLLAFLRSSGFIKRERDELLPPLDRRFDQRVRGFLVSLERQEREDSNPIDVSDGDDSRPAVITVEVALEDGVPHTKTLASDEWEVETLKDLAALVRDGSWTLTSTHEQLKELVKQGQTHDSAHNNSMACSGGKDRAPKAGPPPTSTKADAVELPEDFDPYTYFHENINKLSKGETESLGKDLRLKGQIFPGIGPVQRAVNELQLHGDGFRLASISSLASAVIPERTTLLPFTFADHTILIILRLDHAPEGDRILADAIDSAPWTFNEVQRTEIYASIMSSWRGDIHFPERINWHFGPQQIETWQAEHFVVLNAWCVLLGLPLNNDFQPGDTFIVQVNQLIGVIGQGDADWMLIWAFLRCIGYVSSEEPAAKGRRFSKTVPRALDKDHLDRMDKRPTKSLASESSINSSERFFCSAGVSHDSHLHWDDLEEQDRRVLIPILKRTGRFKNSLTRAEIRNLSHNLPRDFDPCTYFRQRMDALLQTRAADLRDFRDQERETVTVKYGAWLDDTEVSLAVATVTLAITQHQDPSLGFGFVDTIAVQACANGINAMPILPTIRPGRPLLVPIHIRHHYVLLVIHLDENAELAFSVLDSKAYHLRLAGRQQVHDQAWRIVQGCGWGQHVFEGTNMKIPAHTSWVPVSQQPSGDECGYYTILNAWTLALGLLPEPRVHLHWTDQFFRDVNNLVHLARMGHADWSLIYAFLRCRGLILEGHVPLDRQFTATFELRNQSEAYLYGVIDVMRQAEEETFKTQPILDRQQLKNANRLALPEGRRHNSSGAFPSDTWTSQDRDTYASDLARHGHLDLTHNRAQLRDAHANLRAHRRIAKGMRLKNRFLARDPNYLRYSRTALINACKGQLAAHHTGQDLLLESKPFELRELFEDTKHLYNYIFSPDFLGAKLKGEPFAGQRASIAGGVLNVSRGGQRLMLDVSELNLAIAAVVEAIDDLQSQSYKQGDPETIFPGGFSLTTSDQLQIALTVGGATGLSRPRRCWLMPLTVASTALLGKLEAWRTQQGLPVRQRGDADGHHMLAVVQEERHNGQHFEVNIYDSATRVFGDSYEYLAAVVARTARDLRWSTHRNAGGDVVLTALIAHAVPQQEAGGWQCGPHVVINAWILAMGLHPNPNADFTREVYEEFYTLARAACAGLLDWRTLAAWFFCRRLTNEQQLAAVPENRRFNFTKFWPNEALLQRRINEISQNDDVLLESVPESVIDYDLTNKPTAPNQLGSVIVKRRHK